MNYQRKIRLEETDATGVIFFTKLQSIGLEVVENFLNEIGYSVPQFMAKNLLFPIVHVEANYFLPIRCADVLNCNLFLKKLGESSVTFHVEFYLNDKLCGNFEMVNVMIEKSALKSVTMPLEFKNLLMTLLYPLILKEKL